MGDSAVIQVPAQGLIHRAQQHVPLGVGNNLGCIEGLLHVVEAQGRAIERLTGAGQNGRGAEAFLLQRGKETRKDGLADQRQRRPVVQRRHRRPLAGALLAGRVQDLVDQCIAPLVAEGQDVPRDFYQIGIQRPFVPAAKGLAHLIVVEPRTGLQEVTGLADQLHVAVFDAIVDHLDEMTGAVPPDPVTARRAIGHLCCDGLENRLEVRPRFRRTPRHDGRAVARAFFSARYANAGVKKALGLQLQRPPARIIIIGIAAVNDDVARFEMGQELFDDNVHGAARLHHKHDPARPLEGSGQILETIGANDIPVLRLALDKARHLFGGAVVDPNRETVIVHVQDKVLAHYSQPDQSNIRPGSHSHSGHVYVRTAKA